MRKALYAISVLAITLNLGCTNDDNKDIVRKVKEGQNLSGKNFISYSSNVGTDDTCDQEGCEDVTINMCAISKTFPSSIAIIEAAEEPEILRFDIKCVNEGTMDSYWKFRGNVLAVAGGEALDQNADFYMPSDFPGNCVTGNMLATVRIVEGRYWINTCVQMDLEDLSSDLTSKRVTNELPDTFDELVDQASFAIRDFDQACGDTIETIDFSEFDQAFERALDCPSRELIPRGEDMSDDDPEGGDEDRVP